MNQKLQNHQARTKQCILNRRFAYKRDTRRMQQKRAIGNKRKVFIPAFSARARGVKQHKSRAAESDRVINLASRQEHKSRLSERWARARIQYEAFFSYLAGNIWYARARGFAPAPRLDPRPRLYYTFPWCARAVWRLTGLLAVRSLFFFCLLKLQN